MSIATVAKVVRFERSSSSCRQCRVRQHCLPRRLPDDELAEVDTSVRHGRLLPPGHYLYRQGDDTYKVFFVKMGSVKTYFTSGDGTVQVVGFLLAGDSFGIDALEHGRYRCSAVTLEHTSVCDISCAQLEGLYRRHPGLFHELLVRLAEDRNRDHEIRLLTSQKGSDERLAAFLVDMARRLGERGFPATELSLTMSRYDIASYLGVVAETVSRTFTRFEYAGLLAVDGRRVHIRDIDGLCALTGLRAPPTGVRSRGF